MKQLVAGVSVALLLAACGAPSQDTEAVEAPPNSLSDPSGPVTERELPSYGPQGGSQAQGAADSSRTADSGRSSKARGQVLYVPVYSHIFQRSENREFALTATLSIRNTSPSAAIRIRAVDYFDSGGRLLKSHLDQPRTLGPLASTYVVVREEDRSGGVGANFIVEWEGARPVAPPLVESVMISTASTQGISFTSSARVLQEW